MKGLSLPINMIVVLAIAVLVLVVVAAFFVSGGGGSIGSINDQSALGQGCGILRQRGCTDATSDVKIRGYNPYGCPATAPSSGYTGSCTGYDAGNGATLATACTRSNIVNCKEYCCPS